jgi:NAD(P)H-flavin reductase
MAKVIENLRGDDMIVVRFEMLCDGASPGQCINVNGRFFAIADSDENSASVLTRYGGPLDLPEGTEVNVAGPLGKGFPVYDSWDAVIVCGGTATGVGYNLLKYRSQRNLRTWFVSYTRGGHPLSSGIESIREMKGIETVVEWNTKKLGRPDTPFTPLNVKEFPIGTQVFVAGPKELVDSCRSCAEQFGIESNNINLNY